MKINEYIGKILKRESKPMSQVTYWTLFLACGFTYVVWVVSGAATASYGLIIQNPEIASGSWLSQGLFY